MGVRGVASLQHRAQRGGGQEARGVRPRSDPLRRHAPRVLRHPGAGQGHGPRGRTGPAVLPELPRFRRQHLRQCRGQGAGGSLRHGLQRLDDRRVVRRQPQAARSRCAWSPFWDIDATVAEAERVAAKGAKAITFTEMPHALGLPSFHTDPLGPVLRRVPGSRHAAVLALRLRRGAGRRPRSPVHQRPSPCSGSTARCARSIW